MDLMTPVPESLEPELQRIVDAVRRESQVPGIAVVVASRAGLSEAYSGVASVERDTPMHSQSRFQLGCITKVLTSMLAARLLRSGAIELDADIEHYLPELAGIGPRRGVLVRHLLSHTGGYQGLNVADPGNGVYYTWPKFHDHWMSAPQLFSPGSVFSYEHTEFVLLGEIIKRVTGHEVSDCFCTHIFGPLGIEVGSVGLDRASPHAAVADHLYDASRGQYVCARTIAFGDFWRTSLASLTVSVPSLARLCEGIARLDCRLGDAESPLGEILSGAEVRLPSMIGGKGMEQMPSAFGLGCALYGERLSGHNGSARGQTCGMRFDRRSGLSIVVAINAWQPNLRDRLLNRLFSALADVPAAGPAAVNVDPEEFAGTYLGPSGVHLKLEARDGGLDCAVSTRLSKHPLRISLRNDQSGRIVPANDSQHHSIGFFHDPVSDTPCVMFGLTAFKRHTVAA